MSRNTHDDEPHQSDGSDIAEVTQLCHEYSTEREDLHKLGFQCLLKKLKEIEKIILAISKMSGSEAPQSQKDAIDAFRDDVVEAANASLRQPAPSANVPLPQRAPPANTSLPPRAPSKDIQLPNELTFHSKQVLLAIFQQFEVFAHEVTGTLKIKFLETLNKSYCVMESTVNGLSQAQREEGKLFIESLLNPNVQCSDKNTSQRPQNASSANNEHKLNLPEDLSPFTKSVLNEIYANYVTNVNTFGEITKKQIYELLIGAYGKFESSINSMTENQSTELKHEMENIFGGQNGSHRQEAAPKAGSKVELTKDECGFDDKLARHFQELSRVVQVILDKNDDAAAANEKNQPPAVDKEHVSVMNNAVDQVVEQGPVAANANANPDDLSETEYMGIPEFQMDRKRLARLI